MEELLRHIINVPLESIDETTCFKNSTISCELLTCDIPALNDAFFQHIQLIDKLYSFLDNSPPLNPLLASYFAKIVGSLILRKTGQVIILFMVRSKSLTQIYQFDLLVFILKIFFREYVVFRVDLAFFQ